MFQIACQVFVMLCWGGALYRVWTSAVGLRYTTLGSARRWVIAGLMSSGAACLIEALLPENLEQGREIRQQFWYWSTVLLTCPLISVLGCRRPTERVWNLFIVVPLVFVLGWPALTVLIDLPDLHPLQVQTPVVWGFGVVLVMGVGNYLSTRYAIGALLMGGSVIAGLVPMTTFCPAWWPELCWCVPTLMASMAVLQAARQADRKVQANSGLDLIWLDFQETFGLVWSARIMERINQTALQEKWGVSLTPNGMEFVGGLPAGDEPAAREKVLQALRWSLRRFVDPEWIDERIQFINSRKSRIAENSATSAQ